MTKRKELNPELSPSQKREEKNVQKQSTEYQEQIPLKHPHGEKRSPDERVPSEHPHTITTVVDGNTEKKAKRKLKNKEP